MDYQGLSRNASFSIAASSSNVTLVTITLKDPCGVALTVPTPFLLWLSDASTGIGLTGTTASGNVEAGTTGTVLGTGTTKKCLTCLTDASGQFILSITDSAKTGFYVAVGLFDKSRVAVSRVLATADYGA